MAIEIKFKATKRSKVFGFLVIFTLIVLGSGGAWWFYHHQENSSSQKNALPTDDLKTEYKIFKKFGLSFEYPRNWVVKERSSDLAFIASGSLNTLRNEKGGEDSGYADILLENKNNPRHLSLEEFAKEYDAFSSFDNYEKKANISIASREAVYYADTEENADQFPVLIVLIKKNPEEVTILSLHWFYDLKNKNLAPIFDRILSTLKFD